jgi:glycosyltransferase involved in cell wall biosynthesis
VTVAREVPGSGNGEHVLAVATRDPFDVSTFSGLSARLFGGLQATGFQVDGLSTRDLRWSDFLTGALNVRGLLKGQFSGRYAPKVSPRWFWSRHTYELLSARFDKKLAAFPDRAAIVQIGTHVRTTQSRFRSFCVTDTTIVQAVAADEFSISSASGRVVDEAIGWQREIFESCEKVFVLSQWAADSVVGDYGLPTDRVVVLGAGANVSTRLPHSVDAAHPYVLFVGMDWDQKGGPLLLEAFRLVRLELPTARLVVVGCSPQLTEPGVEIVGRLSRKVPAEEQRLCELYAGASCFSILPAFDAFPNVLLEAGFFGVPVVSTRDGSRAEVVLDGETGLLAATRSAPDVAAKIVELLRDPARANDMGAAASRRVDSLFTWPVVIDRLITEAHLERPVRPSAVGS